MHILARTILLLAQLASPAVARQNGRGVMSTAMAMTAAVAHLLELPAKRREPTLYVRLHRTLYRNVGRFAGPSESVAALTTGVLAWWRQRHSPSAFTARAAALDMWPRRTRPLGGRQSGECPDGPVAP